MIPFVVFCMIAGCAGIGFGVYVWKTQSAIVINSLFRKNVNPDDIPALTKRMGISYLIIGCGLVLGGIVMLITQLIEAFIICVIAIAAGGFLQVIILFKYHVL